MIIKEFIENLKEFDENLPITFVSCEGEVSKSDGVINDALRILKVMKTIKICV